MIVTMVTVRVMEMAVDQKIDMVAVRDGFVSTPRSMYVARIVTAATVLGCTPVRIGRRDLNDVLVDMVTVDMMKVAVVQVVDMAIVLDGRMPTVRAVLV